MIGILAMFLAFALGCHMLAIPRVLDLIEALRDRVSDLSDENEMLRGEIDILRAKGVHNEG